MKPEEQRIAIAEACGWIWKPAPSVAHPAKLRWWIPVSVVGQPDWPYGDPTIEIPDYLNDLNAMHEAEKVLTEKQVIWYMQKLTQVRLRTKADSGMIGCMLDRIVFSTASQRSEAFLRTIGKWKDS